MTLPYENATSGDAALGEIRKVLTKFGCARFGTMTDTEAGELIVQFSYRGMDVTARASYRGYAAAWLKEHPYTTRTRGTKADHERKAMKQAEISVCSVLRSGRDKKMGEVVKAFHIALHTGMRLAEVLTGTYDPKRRVYVLERTKTGGYV